VGKVTVRAAVSEDDEAIVAIANAASPGFPPQTVERYRAQNASFPQDAQLLRSVAEVDGTVAGCCHLAERFWTESDGSYDANIAVDSDLQEQGIGSRLYEWLLARARDLDVKRLYGYVYESSTDARQFAEVRGFRETGHVRRLSRLTVEEATFDGYEGLEERLAEEEIRVTTLAALGPDDESVLRAMYAVEISTTKDEPQTESFYLPFEQWHDLVVNGPGASAERIFIALKGNEPIGLTMLQRQADIYGWHNGLGVERPYRGRGVARLLKLNTIRYAREHGIRYLYTGNAADNPRMYDINMRLGYQPLPAQIELVKEEI